jgi:hypothetical protein
VKRLKDYKIVKIGWQESNDNSEAKSLGLCVAQWKDIAAKPPKISD